MQQHARQFGSLLSQIKRNFFVYYYGLTKTSPQHHNALRVRNSSASIMGNRMHVSYDKGCV